MKLNNGEHKLYEWQYRMSGSFYKSLFEMFCNADDFNLDRLAKGFPEEVEAYRRYAREEGYWAKVKEAYNNRGETE